MQPVALLFGQEFSVSTVHSSDAIVCVSGFGFNCDRHDFPEQVTEVVALEVYF